MRGGFVEISDFDFSIAEVLLVHRNRFVEGYCYHGYRSGRRMDGLVLCVSGRGFFDFEDGRVELRAGQMLFLPMGSSYSVSCAVSESFVHYTANFRLSDVDAPEETAAALILDGKHRFVCEDGEDGYFSSCMERLLSLWQAKRNGYRVMARAVLYELLGRYLSGAGRMLRDGEGYGKLRAAKRVMDEDFCHDHGVPELAALCELSETHFRRLWQRVFGMSPTAYLRSRRIARAKDLLLSGVYSVSEAAREVGYADANYFARVFRTETGLTPSEFMSE